MESMPIEDWQTGYLLLEHPARQVISLTYGLSNGLAIWQGDIVLGPAHELQLSSPTSPHAYVLPRLGKGPTPEADLIVGAGYKWPNNALIYEIDPNLPDQSRVTEAIAHWEQKTSVRFVLRTTEPNYAIFVPGSGCSSSIGMVGGQQHITLDDNCAKGNIIHEIGHTLGLYHEQARSDRDRYVTVYTDNLKNSAFIHNFEIVPSWKGELAGGYDYGSIMHYPRDAFAKPGTETIVPKQAGAQIGQRQGLSAGDVAGIDERYEREIILANAFDGSIMQLGEPDAPSAVVEWSHEEGESSQLWTIRRAGQDGSVLLISKHNNMALRYVVSRGTLATYAPNIDDRYQRWVLESRPDDRFRLRNPATGHYIAIRERFGNSNGRPITPRNLPPGDQGLAYEWYYGP